MIRLDHVLFLRLLLLLAGAVCLSLLRPGQRSLFFRLALPARYHDLEPKPDQATCPAGVCL